MNQTTDSKRRTPRQSRAQKTVEAILDAAAQILRKRGDAEFTTNHIAGAAGVSIGTLYQYFRNKDAILARLSDREVVRLRAEVRALTADDQPQALEPRVRQLVRVLIRFFARRRQSRRIVLLNVLTTLSTGKVDAQFGETLSEITDAWNRAARPEHRLDALSTVVLGQALLGVLRSAMFLHPALLDTPELEDRLVHLVHSYLSMPMAAPVSATADRHGGAVV